MMAGFAVLALHAQLASLKPVAMSRIDAPNSGDDTFARIEVWFSAPLEGVTVVSNNDGTHDDSFRDTPQTVYAKALAFERRNAKSIVLTHPDFVPLILNFKEIGLKEPIKPGEAYRIDVEVPSMDFVNGNKAFSSLDFPRASKLFNSYLASGDAANAESARQKLELIEELGSLASFVNANKGSTDLTTRRKTYLAAKELYTKSGAWEAYRVMDALEKIVLPNKNDGEDTGISRMELISVTHDPAKDVGAMSDTTLPLVDGQNYYARIMVDIPLDGVEFEGMEQYRPAEKRNGLYYVYVPKGERQAETFLISHPDFEPLAVALKDHGIPEVKGGRDYHVKVGVPPRAVIEAERAFGALDFSSAIMLYTDILLNADLYDENVLQNAAESIDNIGGLVEKDYAGTWKRLKEQLSRTGTASREFLVSKTDSLIKIASTLSARGVPGMDYNVRKYQARKKEYKSSVYLVLSAYEMDVKGNPVVTEGDKPKPLGLKSLWLRYEVPGVKSPIRQHVYSSGNGVFATYVPEEVTQWLSSNPGKSLTVKIEKRVEVAGAVRYVDYKVRSSGSNKLQIALDYGDRSISASLYVSSDTKK